VGGTWMMPKDAIAARDWGRIEVLARAAKARG
jgi:2-dehydro-3-deoxyphosphogluconate aldolase/(4S)-4-hydroxy-2-oxoglutarate aldolase